MSHISTARIGPYAPALARAVPPAVAVATKAAEAMRLDGTASALRPR